MARPFWKVSSGVSRSETLADLPPVGLSGAEHALPTLRLGTRGSALALWQAEWVRQELLLRGLAAHIEVVRIKTAGDKILDSPLAQLGGKGVFISELEEALRTGEVDLAVHSLKDLPTDVPADLTLAAIPAREDPRDALIAPQPTTLLDLQQGARVGTSSLRRAAQLRRLRPDVTITDIRGNVDTRLRKLREGQYDALIMAAAGLKRLGLTEYIRQILDSRLFVPAVGQGALAIETRLNDAIVQRAVMPLDHAETRFAVTLERAVLAGLGGGCQVPIGVHAACSKDHVEVWAAVTSVDGREQVRAGHTAPMREADTLAERAVDDLLAKGAAALLESPRPEETS